MKRFLFKVIVGVFLSLIVNAASIDIDTSYDEAIAIDGNVQVKIEEMAEFLGEKYESEERLKQMGLAGANLPHSDLGDVFPLLERVEINNKIEVIFVGLEEMSRFSKVKAGQKEKGLCTLGNINEAEAEVTKIKDIYQDTKVKSLEAVPLREEIILLTDYSMLSLGIGLLYDVRKYFLACAEF